jgi:hypothetical protein
MAKKKAPKESNLYTPAELREVANAAQVDPKTVARWLDGNPVRACGKARMIAAWKARAAKMSPTVAELCNMDQATARAARGKP